MDPRDYWLALRKSWVVVIALAIVGGVVAYGYGQTKPDVYQSTSSVFVSATQGATTDQLSQGSTFTQNVVASYATLATTPAVLSPVITELGLDTTPSKLAKNISASNPLNTVFVEITASDGSPVRAAAIANAVASSLRSVSTGLAPRTTSGIPSITMSIVAPAQEPTNPQAPNRHLIEISGVAIGLIAGILFAIGRLLLDTRLRTSRDVELAVETPLIGTVRRHRDDDGLAVVSAPSSPLAEDYRRVRASLQHAGTSGPLRSVLVTSPVGGSGTADLSLNLAQAAAERSKRVLVIEADLRTPSIARLTSLTGTVGLSDVLDDGAGLDSAVQTWTDGVDVLTAGSPLSNPHFALGSSALTALLEKAKSDYDLVIIDTPPLLGYSDALTLVHHTDGALVVAAASQTTRSQLIRTLEAVDAVRAPVLGVVLAGVKQARKGEEHAVHVPSHTASSPKSTPGEAETPVASDEPFGSFVPESAEARNSRS